MSLTKRDIFDTEIAFARMSLHAAVAAKKNAEYHKQQARRHIYHAWKMVGNVARVARVLGLSRPYVSEMISRAQREEKEENGEG